ncbi:MAG TPA: glycoside hydrolase family 125 protein [Candidatus Baltobacteraceae bacterium]|nr:glycoside hydrolase family 125 protein [Candidatus Baltobacteraceae bacterium]
MLHAIVASLLIAQTLIVPLTGARTRNIQTDTLFHTLFHDFFLEDDGTTYVQTGDIPAMWLRDSSAQTIPYVRFQANYPLLRVRFAGVIERDARAIDKDVYANAFQEDYHTWERKWEVDSIAWPVILAEVYLRATGDRTIFTPNFHVALKQIVFTYNCEEHHRECSHYVYPYHVPTKDEFDEGTGLIWGAFRPSDDPVEYRFNIPQNAIAAVALRDIASLARTGYGDVQLSREAQQLEARVMIGILRYGIFYDAQRGVWMYAYETDGYGNYNLMDDANVPNLTELPGIDWCSSYDPIYLNTRAFVLSMDNPWYFSGRYAQGLGSPHTPYGFVWPLGIIGRALTSTDDLEIENSITTLAETDSEDGLIHESFYPDGYWRYTRQEFGWANALYAELLFRTLAGYRAELFANGDGTMVPFELRTQTPVLVSRVDQLDNTADLVGTLGRLLYEGRDAAINQAP